MYWRDDSTYISSRGSKHTHCWTVCQGPAHGTIDCERKDSRGIESSVPLDTAHARMERWPTPSAVQATLRSVCSVDFSLVPSSLATDMEPDYAQKVGTNLAFFHAMWP